MGSDLKQTGLRLFLAGFVILGSVSGGAWLGNPSLAHATVFPAVGKGFADIVKKVTPAVVNIAISGGGGPPGMAPRRPLPPGPFGGHPAPPAPGPPSRPEQSSGSGVIISGEGHIVTNNHVVENASHIKVTLNDKREFTAKVIGVDPKSDLAVIKIDADNLPALPWAEHQKLEVGDLVLAVGSPFGLSSTVTLGIVSALGRGNVGIADYEDFIQTDAAINPGNSGGALVNMDGELIGINTAIFSRTGGSEGIGFAIPSSIALDIVNSLKSVGKVVRGWMGIAIQEVTPALAKSFRLPEQRRGVLISDVNAQGPSAKAGLQRGDVILGFAGHDVDSVSQLRNIVARTTVGHETKVKILREGEEQAIMLTIGERPSDDMLARRSPVPPDPDMAQPPDNVLASLRVQALDADMKSQMNISSTTAGVVINHVGIMRPR